MVGLQAQVGQTGLVSRVERTGDVQGEVAGLGGRQRSVREQVDQAGGGDPFADDVDHAVDLAGVQDPQEPRVGEDGSPTRGPQHPLGLLGLLLGRGQEADPDRPVEQLVLGPPVRRAVRRPEVFLEPVAVDEPGARLDGIRRHGTPDKAAAAVQACVGRHGPS